MPDIEDIQRQLSRWQFILTGRHRTVFIPGLRFLDPLSIGYQALQAAWNAIPVDCSQGLSDDLIP